MRPGTSRTTSRRSNQADFEINVTRGRHIWNGIEIEFFNLLILKCPQPPDLEAACPLTFSSIH